MNATNWIERKSRAQWLEARKDAVNSTEMAALCGIHKYGNTPWSLYHQKIGTLANEWEAEGRTEVGVILEHGISRLAARRLGLKLRKLDYYAQRGDLGASFDYEVISEGEYHGWLVEIKNVDYLIFRDEWGKDEHNRPVAPEHILIQTQVQLEVSQRPGTFLCALVGGNDLKIVEIGRDPAVGDALHKIASSFMQRVRDRGPEPSVVADDASHAREIYNSAFGEAIEAKPGSLLESIIGEYKEAKDAAKFHADRADELKARALLEIKNAPKVFCEKWVVDAGETKASPGTLITAEMVGGYVGARAGFRRFTVKERK